MRKSSPAIPPSVRAEPYRVIKTARRPRRDALLSGALLLVFFVVVFGAVPERLPLLIQRLVGLAGALLAMLFVTLLLSDLGRHYKHFGRSAAHYARIIRAVGWVVFGLVLAWWFTRFAPIQPY
jgi:hypothetical protein